MINIVASSLNDKWWRIHCKTCCLVS